MGIGKAVPIDLSISEPRSLAGFGRMNLFRLKRICRLRYCVNIILPPILIDLESGMKRQRFFKRARAIANTAIQTEYRFSNPTGGPSLQNQVIDEIV